MNKRQATTTPRAPSRNRNLNPGPVDVEIMEWFHSRANGLRDVITSGIVHVGHVDNFSECLGIDGDDESTDIRLLFIGKMNAQQIHL